MCEGAPRQKAAESRKIPESGSVIPREGVESMSIVTHLAKGTHITVIPREGVESRGLADWFRNNVPVSDPERGS